MKNILGKNTSLTILKNNIYTPLCYTEETIRQSVLDCELGATIGKARRETRQRTGTKIEGCFVSRLDKDSAEALFDVVGEDGGVFSLLSDRVVSKNIFSNLAALAFELRAENGGAFYFRVDVRETRESRVEEFNHITPDLKWKDDCVRKETFLYDGRAVFVVGADGEKRLPLIYRFELAGDFRENRKFSVFLCHALNDEFFPVLEGIEKIVVPISDKNGMRLEINGLKPVDDTTNIRVSDEVLVRRKFRVSGGIRFVCRNEERFVQIEL